MTKQPPVSRAGERHSRGSKNPYPGPRLRHELNGCAAQESQETTAGIEASHWRLRP